MERKKTRILRVGPVPVGGGSPVSIQSMTNTFTRDAQATLAQIEGLAAAGCQIVRVAVPGQEDAAALKRIVQASPLPVVADIHFDYKLALSAIAAGVDGLRLNPGNIGEAWKAREVVRAARERSLPIRIGVNGGSLSRRLLDKYGGPTAEALVESALEHVRLLEELEYREIKISLKASRVPVMLEAYRRMAKLRDYPLHLGVTEAGLPETGAIRSAVGIGALLAEGIGDTIRVSLTADPVEEVLAAKEILRSLELSEGGLRLVSCPTCGRTEVDLIGLARRTRERLEKLKLVPGRPLTVAVMGCVVNGPGEAREADFGIAGGKGKGILFARGQRIAVLPEEELIDALAALIAESDFVCEER